MPSVQQMLDNLHKLPSWNYAFFALLGAVNAVTGFRAITYWPRLGTTVAACSTLLAVGAVLVLIVRLGRSLEARRP